MKNNVFQISLLFNVESASSCTVSILAADWLATSHSCLASASLDPVNWVLFGGPAGGNLDVNGTQIKTVRDIVSHPQNRRSQHLFSNDLALVRLEDPLEFNDEVSSICVASKIPDSDQLCVTAGWTAGEEAGVTYSQYLNYLPQPVVPDLTCNSTSMYSGKLTHDSFCSRADGDSKLCQVWIKNLFSSAFQQIPLSGRQGHPTDVPLWRHLAAAGRFELTWRLRQLKTCSLLLPSRPA